VALDGEMFERLNTPMALAIALAFFLVVDSIVIYRYHQEFQGNNVSETADDADYSLVAEQATTPVAQQEEGADGSENDTAPVVEKQQADESENSTVPAVEQEPSTAEEGAASPEAAVPAPEGAKPVRVVVDVVDAPSWLRVQEDRQVVLDQPSEPGFSREFVGDRAVTVQAEDAGDVRVEVNGQDVGPLGDPGEAATRTYTAQ
jgi:hypothetical protein